jgi:Uma2 family endonuclease
VVPMSPKGNRHELVKAALQQHWFPRIVDTPISLITETTLYIAEDEFFEPDFLFWPRAVPLQGVTAATALLIVEVSDTSLGYDLGRKAAIYARLGLAELWVIDANTLATTIHRSPSPNGFADTRNAAANELLEPMQAPQLAVSIAALRLT